jgi:hypothetical protein
VLGRISWGQLGKIALEAMKNVRPCMAIFSNDLREEAEAFNAYIT